MPEDPQQDPGQAVDALEDKVAGSRHEQYREEPTEWAGGTDSSEGDSAEESSVYHGGEPPS